MFSLTPCLQGEERAWRLNQLLMTDYLINYACVVKPPLKPKRKRSGASGLVNTQKYRDNGALGEIMEALSPHAACAVRLFYLAVPELGPFI